MKRNKKMCSKCNRMISLSNFDKHVNVCDGVKKNFNEWKQSNGLYKCPHCSLTYTKNGIGTHIWRKHTEEGRAFTSTHDPNVGYKNGVRTVWNKGLTKEHDARVLKIANTLKDNIKSGLYGDAYTRGALYKWTKKNPIDHKKAASKGGGFRMGAGRGKRGWYKGYWCDSSWELAWVIYNLDHGISFERNREGFTYIFEGAKYKYYPDFIMKDTYVEIKGYENDKFRAKKKQFPQKLKVLYFKEIKPILEYVENKYGKDFVKLYK